MRYRVDVVFWKFIFLLKRVDEGGTDANLLPGNISLQPEWFDKI